MADWSAGDSSSRAKNAVNNASNGKIQIKPSHKGLLHKDLDVPEGQPIPASKLSVKPGDSPALKSRKVFAENAKNWKKG